MNIQIVMDQGIGNMVKLTPAIRGITKRLPDAKITVLCKPPADQVIRGWSLVDKVLTEPDNREYDLIYMTIWSDEYAQKYGTQIVGNGKDVRKVPLASFEINEAFAHMPMAWDFGFTGELPKTYCRTKKVPLPWIEAQKGVIALSDTTADVEAWQRKRWNGYPELALALKNLGYFVLLIGGQAEADRFDPDDWPEGIYNLQGKYTIPELAYILKHCDLFIGNDSGPAHIAAAMGTRTIVLFGPTKVRKNRPLGKNVSILTANLPCSPCQYTPAWDKCTDWKCMDAISVSDVIAEIENPSPQSDGCSISACMIVKDEEKNLGKCLDSIQDIVDEIIIVDTGSSDRTVEIAESYEKAQVYHFPWTGSFSEARNESIKYATKDWILIIDADEWIEDSQPDKIRAVLARVEKEGIPINAIIGNSISMLHGGTSKMQREYFFRKGMIHYEKRVHNQPIFPGNNLLTDLEFHHSGYALSPEEQAAKRKRTELLLLEELKEHPLDAHSTMNLIRAYRGQSRWDDMIKTSKQFHHGMADAGNTVPPVVEQMILTDIMCAYQGKAQDYAVQVKACMSEGNQEEADRLAILEQEAWEDAIKVGEDITSRYPQNLDSAFYLAMLYRRQGEHEKAIKHFSGYISTRLSAELGPRKITVIEDTWGALAQAWNNIGLCEYERRYLTKAIMCVWIATELDPENKHFYDNLSFLWGTAIRAMNEESERATEEEVEALSAQI